MYEKASSMDSTTIADAKNNLPKLIHAAQAGEDIHLTRHGQPVAVIISEARYQQMLGQGKSVFHEMLKWRSQHGSIAITDDEISSWRNRLPDRKFSWE
jgi:prevent-host-death family protein